MQEIEESVDNLRRTTNAIARGLDLTTRAEWMGGFGTLIWNLETNEMYLSEGIYKIFGIKRTSKFAMAELAASVVHPDDVEASRASLAAAAVGQPLDLIHRVVHPSGEVRVVHAKAQRIEGDADNPAIVLGTIVDITPTDDTQA